MWREQAGVEGWGTGRVGGGGGVRIKGLADCFVPEKKKNEWTAAGWCDSHFDFPLF